MRDRIPQERPRGRSGTRAGSGYRWGVVDDLTDDESFWQGCNGCVNVDILQRTHRKYCICTAMLYDPEEHLPAKIPQDVLDRIRELDKNEETTNDENYG